MLKWTHFEFSSQYILNLIKVHSYTTNISRICQINFFTVKHNRISVTPYEQIEYFLYF